MSTLATFRTNILALLDDPDLERFTNDQVDAALRWALNQYSAYRPLVLTYNLDTDGNSLLECPADFEAMNILKVELFADEIDDVCELEFQAWRVDEAWFIQTTAGALPAGEVLTLTYSAPHAIDDLDGAAGTTVPPADENLLQVGAAGYALRTRAASRIEGNNLNADTAGRLMQLAEQNITFFTSALSPAPSAGYAVLPRVPVDTF